MNNRVVIVETDEVASKVISLVLRDSAYDPLVISGDPESCAQVAQRMTELAIISIELAGNNGFTVCKQLRAEGYSGPVIFMSTRNDVSPKLEAFALGADDYIVKPFEPLELVARVQSVIRRFRIADQNRQEMLVRVEDAELSVGRLTYKSAVVAETALTPTEMKILEYLMRNNGITISRSRLTERVWGFDFVGDTNRVDVYIRRVRHKIEVNPARPEYLHTVRGLGYVFTVKSATGSQIAGQSSAYACSPTTD